MAGAETGDSSLPAEGAARPGDPLPKGGLEVLPPARLLCTTRAGGVSLGAFAANNLALHVEDVAENVLINRSQLSDLYGIHSLQWLEQVHGTRVLEINEVTQEAPVADAMFTTRAGIGLAILTADCLPVVLVDQRGALVAAAHAGWRGLCAGILPKLIAALPVPPERLSAFLGPAIGPAAFEVGVDVIDALKIAGLNGPGVSVRTRAEAAAESGENAEGADGGVAKYRVDLALAARLDLNRAGVSRILGGGWCTYEDTRFYSWRRETHRASDAGETPATGRQATIVWLPGTR